MDGFRFWKQGFWETHLKGKPYHISALYVVDLAKFRLLKCTLLPFLLVMPLKIMSLSVQIRLKVRKTRTFYLFWVINIGLKVLKYKRCFSHMCSCSCCQ